ncbi:hypothetical protein HL033_02295 [Neoehrlichia mikurensis]|nr:hypothetical protein [Neoehrlichia mikurensis]QXK93286.1 hypothetical protein HL033_02295 [Neoehrlichia mikurensis]
MVFIPFVSFFTNKAISHYQLEVPCVIKDFALKGVISNFYNMFYIIKSNDKAISFTLSKEKYYLLKNSVLKVCIWHPLKIIKYFLGFFSSKLRKSFELKNPKLCLLSNDKHSTTTLQEHIHRFLNYIKHKVTNIANYLTLNNNKINNKHTNKAIQIGNTFNIKFIFI